MLTNWSLRFSEKLAEAGVIEKDDLEIYVYGFQQGAIMLFNILTTLVLGFLLHAVAEVILFMAVYIPIRTYAGGYHADTQTKCYFFSVGIILFAVFAMSVLRGHYIIGLCLAVVSFLLLYRKAPVEDKNKPLDETEMICYHKRMVGFSMIGLAALVGATCFHIEEVCVSITVAFLVLAGMILLGIEKNKKSQC